MEKLEREVEMTIRHLRVLKLVKEMEPIGIMKLSAETGLPSHKVRYSLRVLEHGGLIAPSQQGAVTTERTATFLREMTGRINALLKSIQQM